MLGFNKTLILQCCDLTPAKILLLWKTLTPLQPKPVWVYCASYYKTLFLLLQLWSFQSGTHYFSIYCNTVFLIHKIHEYFLYLLCFLCSPVLGSSEMKKNLTCLKTAPAAEGHTDYTRSHSNFCSMALISHRSPPSQSTHVVFVSAIRTCCGLPRAHCLWLPFFL